MILKMRDSGIETWVFIDNVSYVTHEIRQRNGKGQPSPTCEEEEEYREDHPINNLLESESKSMMYIFLRVTRMVNGVSSYEEYACNQEVFLLNDNGQTIEKIKNY